MSCLLDIFPVHIPTQEMPLTLWQDMMFGAISIQPQKAQTADFTAGRRRKWHERWRNKSNVTSRRVVKIEKSKKMRSVWVVSNQ